MKTKIEDRIVRILENKDSQINGVSGMLLKILQIKDNPIDKEYSLTNESSKEEKENE